MLMTEECGFFGHKQNFIMEETEKCKQSPICTSKNIFEIEDC